MRINRPCLRLPLPRPRAPTDTPSHFPFRERKMHAALLDLLTRVATVGEHLRGRHFFAAFLLSWLPRSSFHQRSLARSPLSAASCRGEENYSSIVLSSGVAAAPRRAERATAAARRQPTSMRHQTDPMIRHRRLSGSPASLRYTSAQAAAQISPERTSNTLRCF